MSEDLRLEDFDYPLPRSRIAQRPAPERDAARLLVLERGTGTRHHARIGALGAIEQAHTADEWIDTREIRLCADVLESFARSLAG